MHPFIKLFILFICFAGYSTASGNSALENGTIIWPEKEPSSFKSSLKTTYDDEGLGPWYSLANSFIGTVLNKDPWALAGKALNKGIGSLDIKEDVIMGYAIGMIVTVAIGILFCIFMPIVGFCFCCCRCCGNCGGEMTQKDSPRNGCKRAVFGILLSLITLLMFAGVLLTFVCNDNLSKTLDKAKQTSTGIVEDTTKFINQTIGEFDSLLGDDMAFVIGQLKKDITDAQLQKLVGDPFSKLVDVSVAKPIEAVKDLSINADKMEKQLDIIVANTNDLKAQGNALSTGLNDAKTNITQMLTECGTIPGASCSGIDANQLQQGANFSLVPDVNSELSNIRNVTQQNFTAAAEEGLQTLKDIPQTLINKTRSTRADISKMITNATQKGNDILNDVRSSSNKVILDPLKNVEKNVHKYVDFGKQYDRYRWYAGVALTCLLLLIVVLIALGLMCGICGQDKHSTPSSRGSVSNMGGNCLMAATGFCFIFASLLMLLTTICFLIGAPMQGIVCEPIQSGKIFSEFLDNKKYFATLPLSSLLKSNKSFKIGEALDNCRNNQPAYTALQLVNIFNISKLLNIKELLGDKVDKQFDDLKVNLTDQTLLTNDSKQSLNKLNTSGVEKINFTQFTEETRKGITTTNLTEYADQLDAFATNMTTLAANLTSGSPPEIKAKAIAEKATYTAAGLRALDKNIVQGMGAKANELDKNVVELKKIGGNLANDATKALDEAEKAEKSLHESSQQITDVIVKYKDRVLGWGYQLTDHILNLVNNNLGRCKPLTNVFDAVIVLACNDFLSPFNGFWLGIGFCLFFFIPAIIFSIKLAKHYRRMSYESDFDDYGGTDVMEMGQPVGQEKKLWANPKESNGTWH